MLGNADMCAVVATKDLSAARKFYEETLGLKLASEDMGGVTYQSGNGKLFVYESSYAGTNQATAVAWAVTDVQQVVDELKNKGVVFEHYPDMPETELRGDIHVMGEMESVWFKDPDGNILNVNNMK